MADISHQFAVASSLQQVFRAMTIPECRDAWWTKRSSGKPIIGTEYILYFSPIYDWRAVVTKCEHDSEFELQITRSDKD